MSRLAHHPASLPAERLLAECDVERLRRTGPGGQHRNKVETAIRLIHRPTGTVAQASERRSQSANHAQAVRRLRIRLALEVRMPPPPGPSKTWRAHQIGERVSVNCRHADFPALLAEALDVAHAADWDLAAAASSLGCTLSQLLKLLRMEPSALRQVNHHRTAHRKPPYR